ncbi:AtzH-like domain-containing protein [Nocardia mexicana]|uniref:Asp-tRNA(Asn)/Glu-tRNA(Gln) amidotransferase A subunit family amidase n=1 Tax=Nocardia mexicana TaxID=279262 RepID=A0A370HFK6_9NOCA|nr:AtzH-like domain-containing protein [Nocardia mexicana]RDI56014.1 Asp-tRNA(Asn)/Glu-tRNA(Gln) amidotransferase A subunit family amidase [Nocardia mexicana]
MISPFDDLDGDLRAAFARYERALMANDLAELDAAFADGPRTIRGDASTALVGHDAIAEFRAGRAGAPARSLVRVYVRRLGPDAAVIVAETRRADGTHGIQTQVWERGLGPWEVTVAHVSGGAPPARGADVVPDQSIWRVAPGDRPLAVGGAGPLRGARVAVKDLFAVAGQAVGAGNPAWLAAAPVESGHAAAVAALLSAGADITGIAATDELAFSLSGVNIHYGTTPNPLASQRISGGSSSGPAAAVAAGLADIGLGTDTAGSIRVPASYCGLYGVRTTHGAVARDGLVGLAPSFDAVGVLTRDPDLLARAAAALLPVRQGHPVTAVLVAPELTELLEPAARESFSAAVQALTLRDAATRGELPPPRAVSLDYPDGGGLDAVLAAFRTVQAAEAWRTHGEFVAGHPDALAPEVAARFRAGSHVDPAAESAARQLLDEMSARLRGLLPPGTVLALPSASSAAPRCDAPADAVETVRQNTLRLTCLASLAGLPALSLPMAVSGTLPIGVSLLAGPGEDATLLEFARTPFATGARV